MMRIIVLTVIKVKENLEHINKILLLKIMQDKIIETVMRIKIFIKVDSLK